MPGKAKKVGVTAPGTPKHVKETYEALKEDPEARKFAREKGRHGLKGTLAAIAWTRGKGKGKKKKKMEKSAIHILVKAGARPHKYVKRVPQAGGGYRYIYHDPRLEGVGKVTTPYDLETPLAQKFYVKNMASARHALREVKASVASALKHIKRGDEKTARKFVDRATSRAKTWVEATNAQLSTISGGLPTKERHNLKEYFSGTESALMTEINRAKRGLPKERESKQRELWEEAAPGRTPAELGERQARREAVTKKSIEALAVEAATPLNLELLVKAARGGKYLKRVPKAGGGYSYVYHSEKHRVAHHAERMEQRAKQLHARAKSLEQNDMLAQASKARGKAELLMKLARRARRGTGMKSSSPAKATAMKSFEALAIEAAAIESGGAIAGEALAKAMVEVPSYGKTKKKNISNVLLLRYLKAKVRSSYRDSIRYGSPSSAQAIYDWVLSSAMHQSEIQAAIEVLEKQGTPFSIDFVKKCIAEVEESSGAETPAVTDTTRGSVAASGG